MRRFLAFILGMVFGIVFVLGAIAGAVYIAVAVIHPNHVIPDSGKYLGDFTDMSIVDMIKSVKQLYLAKLGVSDENGNYYTLGEFLTNYNINVNSALGFELPKDLLDIPAFEFFNSDNGVEKALKQIKVSSIPSIVNLFGVKNEDGSQNGFISDYAVKELSNYTLHDLLADESKGLSFVFQNIKFADVMQSSFPSQDGDNKLMWALGQSSIGKLLGGVKGENNFLMQLKPDGALETLGGLSVLEILGDGSQYLKAIFGDVLTSQLIDENGELNLDTVINGVSLGEILGCRKNEIDASEYKPIIFEQSEGETDKIYVAALYSEDNVIYAKSEGEKFYEAKLSCLTDEHRHSEDCAADTCGKKEHAHNADCYDFVWYSQTACQEDHQHLGELNSEGAYYPEADALYTVLANTTMSELTNGNSNALLEKIKVLKIGELLGNQEITGVMSNFTDLTMNEIMNGAVDELFLGSFFAFQRVKVNAEDLIVSTTVPLYYKENEKNEFPVYYLRKNSNGNCALSTDQETWYAAEYVCENDSHDSATSHIASCYSFEWYVKCDASHADGVCQNDVMLNDIPHKKADGIQGKLASKQIRNLKDLNDEVKKLTLFDVLGNDVPDVLNEIAHTPIGELNGAINKMYVGGLLQYGRKQFITDVSDESIRFVCDSAEFIAPKESVKILYDDEEVSAYLVKINDELYAMSDDGKTWYEAHSVCLKEHSEHSERNCYAYCWYDGEEENEVLITGMMAKLAENKVAELGSLNDTIRSFTLRDVLGDDIPEMMLPLADSEIGNLKNDVDKLYVGDVLKSKRRKTENVNDYGIIAALNGNVCVRSDGTGKYVKTDDGKIWYEAILNCEKAHIHDSVNCYDYVWYEKCSQTNHAVCGESVIINDAVHHTIKGLTSHIVTIKIGELNSSSLTDAVNGMTLGEIIPIDGNTNKIISEMRNVRIKDLGNELNDIYLGSAMNYTRKTESEENYTEVLYDFDTQSFVMQKINGENTEYIKSDDGKIWYKATLNCTKEENHKADCYEYVWYVRCEKVHPNELCPEDTVIDGAHYNPVSGITKAFVNSKLKNVSETINRLTLRKLGINIEGNNLLKAIQDKELNEMGESVNSIQLGVVLGYTRGEKTSSNPTCGAIHAHDENCYEYNWLDENGRDVKGLNGKIANLTVGGIAGGNAITNIAKSLSMQDLIDSEMLVLNDTQTAKLNALFGSDAWKTVRLTDFIGSLLDRLP